MLNPLFHAQSKLRRRDFDGCIELCNSLLTENPRDQAAWFLKCRALTEKDFVDDTEWDEEGIAEVLLDDNAMAQAPRPGTSLQRIGTSAGSSSSGRGEPNMRPMTASGRPVTGFARPGTSSLRPATGASGPNGRMSTSSGRISSAIVGDAFRGNKPGTARPLTALGRQIRLGTASLSSTPGGPFVNVEKLDLKRYAARPAIAKAFVITFCTWTTTRGKHWN